MEPHEVEILLVEDNPHEAELTIRSLKKSNLANKLKLIDDGADALDFIFLRGAYADATASFSPKLVLLDLKLPRVDGLEILRQMKADDRTKGIPVVILTSSKEERDIIESYKLGVNSYIVKPVNFESFTKSVSELGMYWLLLNQPS
jgi:two-component system, response regulator